MASTIFFNGRLISVPGSYTEVDASGLESVGLSAVGIIGILGEAEGGRPASDMTEVSEFITINKPEKANSTFRSGPLLESMPMLFGPARDPDIQGGAVSVVAMKVNPATQSTLTLSNAYGSAIDLTSSDWGAFTNQINVTIASGTTQGKLVTVGFEDTVESGDDIGGDSIFSLKYVGGTTSWETMSAEITADRYVKCSGTRADLGLDGDIAAQLAVTTLIEVVSASASDTTQQVIVYGLTGAGAAQSETLALNGTTARISTTTFSKIHGARIVGTTVGVVTVRISPVGATILTIAAGTNTVKGLVKAFAQYIASSKVTVVADAATTKPLIVAGYSVTGAVQIEKFALNGTTPVTGSLDFSQITFIALGEVEAARTVTTSATAALTSSTQNTITKCADFFNSRYDLTNSVGFVWTTKTPELDFDPVNLDVTTGAGGPVTCLSPAVPDFYANLYAVIDWINSNSQYIDAEVASGAKGGAPTNSIAAQFLGGGSEGVTTQNHWQGALDLLKRTRVNSVVVLTGDPAVHAVVEAHCAYMSGIGRSERDCFIGLLNTGLTDVPTKTEARNQIIALNSRHVRAFAQAIERYNSAGERVEYSPCYQAVVAAGMQAGSPVGQSLTYKYANVLSIRQDATWNPTDDAEEMIQSGLCFMENIEGLGRRVVRNITTHLTSDNIAYTEGSVNEAVNYAVYTFRTNMEYAVGKRGFSGTVNAAKGVAINTLGLLKDANILIATRSLNIELIVDVLEVSVEMAPVIPINFVKSTVHLVTIAQSA